MALEAPDILTRLQKGEYAPIYFLQGEEPFFIDQIAEYIESKALDESQKGFNLIVLYGKEVAIHDIMLNARRFPMMSDRQVVIVKEAQEIKDIKKQEAIQLLEAYVDNPQPSTILVFCHKYRKIDGRTGLGKKLRTDTVFLDTRKLYENQVAPWIENHAKSLGMRIGSEAAQMMSFYNGNNIQRINNELLKIKNNLKGADEITVEAVQTYSSINREYNMFEFTKSLMLMDTEKALRIVNYFDANIKNNPIIPVIAMIHSVFVKLLLLHRKTGASDAELSQQLGINRFFLNEYKTGARNYPLSKVIRNIGHIAEADKLSKGVDRPGISDGQVLKDLTFKLMHQAQ